MLLWSRSAKRRTAQKSAAKAAKPIGTEVGLVSLAALAALWFS
jgi:hypothetical protein